MSKRVQNIILPDYTKNEERLNAFTHLLGALFGVVALILNISVTYNTDSYRMITGIFYGLMIIVMYAVSTIYHALPTGDTKRLWRIIDHCTVYLLIIGTYTPIVLVGVRSISAFWGWFIFALELGIGAFAIVLNILDLKRYTGISMVCYIAMGWCILVNLPIGIEALTMRGFYFVLAGGVVYTVGAILYGVGKKYRYFHAIFHIFTVAAAILQYVGVYECILK